MLSQVSTFPSKARSIGLCLIACGAALSAGIAQNDPTPPPALIAKLQIPLETRHLKTGSEVLASTIQNWQGVGCTIKTGGLLYGHVTDLTPPAKSRGASIKVTFDKADCNGEHAAPFSFVLVALAVPPEKDSAGDDMFIMPGHLFKTEAEIVNFENNTGFPKKDTSRTKNAPAEDDDTKGIRTDEVRGAPKLSLYSIPAESLTELHSQKKDFELGLTTKLVFHALKTEDPATAAATATVVAVAQPVPPPPPARIDQTEICAEGCSVIEEAHTLTPAEETALLASPSSRITLTSLGYHPRPLGHRTEFDRETTVTYLSANELLLTFDLHRLRERTGPAWHSGSRRMTRGVLINAQTHAVERVVDWKAEGIGEYLWRLGNGHVLLHQDGAFHLIGPGLRTEASIPVHGELLWVSTSPSGDRIAFGTLNERHDKATHMLILDRAHRDPEEDVEMHLVDATGKELMRRTASTTMRAPVLTDEGELLALPVGGNRWQIVEKSFEGETVHTLTEVYAQCAPVLTSSGRGLVSVRGCAARGEHWFRVLRENGHTLLKKAPTIEEMELNTSYSGRNVIAVGAATRRDPKEIQGSMQQETLDHERIELHRVSDGKDILSVVLSDFPPSRSAYAVSPDDDQFAAMTKTGVQFYQVEASQ